MLIPKDTDERVIYARRIVAGRCLYGVDKNPLACEMAKLSLWLLTLAKDMPFTFLDHAIRCGDSLVGISSTDQLEYFSLTPHSTPHTQLAFAHEQIRRRLDATRLLRRQIEERFDSTVEDTEQKALMLKNADEQTRRLAYAADMLIAAHWQQMSEAERERELSDTLPDVEFKFKDLPVEQLDREADDRLHEVQCAVTLHWPLEYPEVFERGGFDAFVCNPPFQRAGKIIDTLGASYRNFIVQHLANGRRGTADLCTYFFLRAHQLGREGSNFGMLATNTIGQGDTREVGLEQLERSDAAITGAISSRKWPGSATVEFSAVWIHTGRWDGVCILDEERVPGITSFLTCDIGIDVVAHRLAANGGRLFKGHKVYGKGFVLDDAEARSLKDADARSRDVLFPYLNGEDLNSRPDQSASRWVINFRTWPLEKAQAYPQCLDIVRERVKPERDRNRRKARRERWWQYGDYASGMESAIAGLDRVIVTSEVGNMLSFAVIENACALSHMLLVLADNTFDHFAVLQSSAHEIWARQFGSSMRTDLPYTRSDCFETYPFPPQHASLIVIGEAYHKHRRQIMLDRQEGLTKTYNRFHDPDETAADIQKLRELHVEMDKAVAAAYGWTDLDLRHGFHETKQGIRYTISEPARREVLQRLLKLNHERYEEEVRQGLHEKKGKAKRKKTGQRRSRKKKTSAGQRSLFDADDDDGQPAPGKAGRTKSKTQTTTEEDGKPLRIEEYETDEAMATFRQAARGRGWMDRQGLFREVLALLGYRRLGPHKTKFLKGHLRAAIRRKIIEADGDDVRLCTSKMADYELEELRETLCSVMRKGRTYDREEVVHAVAAHLGFTRVREEVRQPIKSAINSAIRQGILGYEGSVVWRE